MGKLLKNETKARAAERHAVLQKALLLILPIVNYLWFEEVMDALREKGVHLPDAEVEAALIALMGQQKAKYKEGETRSGRLWKRI